MRDRTRWGVFVILVLLLVVCGLSKLFGSILVTILVAGVLSILVFVLGGGLMILVFVLGLIGVGMVISVVSGVGKKDLFKIGYIGILSGVNAVFG